MSKTIFVKPVDGRKVRNPKNMEYLPADGAEVPADDRYWLRRLSCGEIEVVAPAVKSGSQTDEEKAKVLALRLIDIAAQRPTEKRIADMRAIEAELGVLGFPLDEPVPKMSKKEIVAAQKEFDAAQGKGN